MYGRLAVPFRWHKTNVGHKAKDGGGNMCKAEARIVAVEENVQDTVITFSTALCSLAFFYCGLKISQCCQRLFIPGHVCMHSHITGSGLHGKAH